jgi:hypothetical protein
MPPAGEPYKHLFTVNATSRAGRQGLLPRSGGRDRLRKAHRFLLKNTGSQQRIRISDISRCVMFPT